MAKTHKRPCARGTIHYANEVPPYGESQLSAQHTNAHTQAHAHTHTHTQGNMSTLRSQVLSLIFMLNLQSLVTSHLCSVCNNEKKGKRQEENRMRGEDKRWIGREEADAQ